MAKAQCPKPAGYVRAKEMVALERCKNLGEKACAITLYLERGPNMVPFYTDMQISNLVMTRNEELYLDEIRENVQAPSPDEDR